ncbi:uncharacterized protein LOC143299375 isoform X2 [Babylonia areolata]
MKSNSVTSLLTTVALMALALCCAAYPFPNSLLHLEDELDALVHHPPPQHSHLEAPPPPEEAPQDVSQNGESSLEKNHQLHNGIQIEDTDDASPTGNAVDESAADDEIPFRNHLAGATEDDEDMDELQRVTSLDGDSGVEVQERTSVWDDSEDLHGLNPPAQHAQENSFHDSNRLSEDEDDEALDAQDEDNEDSQEDDLRRLQADSEDGEEEQQAPDSPEDLSLPDAEEQDENDAAAQELDSMTQPDDDLYDGYHSDDNNPDLGMKNDNDVKNDESYPADPSHGIDTPSFLEKQGSLHPDSVWKLEEEKEASRFVYDDVMAAEGVDLEEEKRAGEEAAFRPVRVIELNETLYLNSTDEHLPKFQPVPMPDKFEDYDINNDGVISLPELRYISRATEGAWQAFQDADSDGDGWVNREEFQRAGWGVPVNSAPPSPPPDVFDMEDAPPSLTKQRLGAQ